MTDTIGHAAPPMVRCPRTRGRVIDRSTALTALWFGALVVGTWPLVLAAAGPQLPLVGVVAHVAGMLAGYGVLVLLVLIGRSPALERGVGADVLTRWHSMAGRIVVLLVLVHAVGAIAAWAQPLAMALAGHASSGRLTGQGHRRTEDGSRRSRPRARRPGVRGAAGARWRGSRHPRDRTSRRRVAQ